MGTHAVSRSFRAISYEPEAIFAVDTYGDVLGWQGRLLGLGVSLLDWD